MVLFLVSNGILWPRRLRPLNAHMVTFPTFSIIQDDNDMLRGSYLKVIKYISLVTFPMLAGMIAVAPEFIPMMFLEKWAPMIVPLQILCVPGALKSVATTVGSIFLSKGRAYIQLKWNIFTAIVLPIAILIRIRYGITGVAMVITIMSYLIILSQDSSKPINHI